jgi:F0F1-type ATP synthase delta subunit
MGVCRFAILSAAVLMLVQSAIAEERATGLHESHSHPGLHDHHTHDHPRAMHDRPDLFHLHNMIGRIDSAQGLTDAQRLWLHEKTDSSGRIAAEMHDATQTLEDLRAEGGGTITEARKAEIEAQIASQIQRIQAGQAELKSLQGQVQDRIESDPSLTDAQKQKVREIMEKAKDRAITVHQAETALGESSTAKDVELAVVLFILLVIVGGGWG